MDSARRPPPPVVEYFEPEYETLEAGDIRALQLRMLNEDLLRVQSNRFYARWWSQHGVRHPSPSGLDEFRALPVVRKKQILEDADAHPPYGSRLQVGTDELVEVVESSGTSGYAREMQALTEDDRELVLRAKMFQFYWVGCRKATVVALHIPVTMAAGALWSLQALQRLKSNVLRLGNHEAETRLQYMKRFNVEVTAASTSYLMRLEHAAAATNVRLQEDFPRLRSIYVGSGGWSMGWAQERAELWNARLYEVYGSSQRAFAITCEWGIERAGEPGVMHFLPQLALTEVVNPRTGEHVGHGEEGEVVITPFGQRASPLIRYATGDRATFIKAGSCPCGRQFDGIAAGSVARYDDMLRLKELNVWPETIDAIVLAKDEVLEYRGDVFVDELARETVELHVEFRREVSGSARHRILRDLEQEIHARIGLRFRCTSWSGPSLVGERGPGFSATSLKIRRWTDRRIQTREKLVASAPKETH